MACILTSRKGKDAIAKHRRDPPVQSLVAIGTGAALVLAGPMLGVLSLPPASHGLVLVLAPPWVNRETAIRAAGGHGVGPTAPLGTLTQADDPGFGDLLRAAGPFLVVDGQAIATLCGVSG